MAADKAVRLYHLLNAIWKTSSLHPLPLRQYMLLSPQSVRLYIPGSPSPSEKSLDSVNISMLQ